MALTARQRNALPASAFAYPSMRSFPVPTREQARRAGIPEAQRLRILRNALARAAQPQTHSNYPRIARIVRARAGGQIASLTPQGRSSYQGGSTRRRRGRRRTRARRRR